MEAAHLDLATQDGVDHLHGDQGPSDRRAHGQCRARTWARVSRSGP
ncbi:hypothetical protein JOH49_003983 [Bradyrhizobium elkanii]|uniref:Uncharacterized protein n=1 Tax=Bradyrhizobium elkanii TaxID=29448 RepID=A0A8I2C0X8_BRAEL|nr:hypothetical protein [Bradyrhizobium elkanii]